MMQTTGAAEAAVESLRSQLDEAARPLARARVRWRVQVRRLKGGDWLVRLPLRDPDFSFEPPGCVEVGKRQVLADQDAVSLVRVTYANGHLTLRVASRLVGIASREEAETERTLARARDLMSAERDPLRRVVATRAVRGVTRVIAAARPDTMAEAASESSDVGVLVWALKQPEAIETLTLDDLLAPARLQGLRERERLLKEGGGTLRADEVAQQLQLTRQAVNRRRQLGKLLALDAGRHGFLYPAWQFRAEGTIEGLEPVLRGMAHLDPWMKQAFILGASSRLHGRRPFDLLKAGEVAAVVAAAEAFGDHGAS